MINRKLRSRRGATIVFAMVAMLVAIMVSAVIIFAATANAGRVGRARREEQAYLTVSSAAELIRSAIADDSVTYTVTETETVEYDQIGNMVDQDADVGNPTGWTYHEADGGQDNVLSEKLVGWIRDTVTYNGTYNDTLTLSVKLGEEELEPVSIRLQMLDGSIVAVVSLGDSAEPNYTMSLSLAASSPQPSETSGSYETPNPNGYTYTTVTTKTYTVKWPESGAVIEKGDKLGATS